MLTLPSFGAAGIARGVGGAAARQTKTHTSGPAPADGSRLWAAGIARGVGGAAARQTKTYTSGPAPADGSRLWAAGIARGVGGAAARQTKTHTSGPAPADGSRLWAAGIARGVGGAAARQAKLIPAAQHQPMGQDFGPLVSRAGLVGRPRAKPKTNTSGPAPADGSRLWAAGMRAVGRCGRRGLARSRTPVSRRRGRAATAFAACSAVHPRAIGTAPVAVSRGSRLYQSRPARNHALPACVQVDLSAGAPVPADRAASGRQRNSGDRRPGRAAPG